MSIGFNEKENVRPRALEIQLKDLCKGWLAFLCRLYCLYNERFILKINRQSEVEESPLFMLVFEINLKTSPSALLSQR